MLSGHSRHTHSVSVPNISVLLHTHVEAVLKFEVVSHFAHFWSYFSTNFHMTHQIKAESLLYNMEMFL